MLTGTKLSVQTPRRQFCSLNRPTPTTGPNCKQVGDCPSCGRGAAAQAFHSVLILYEGRSQGTFPHAISLQPLGVGHATIPHIKAMDVPFHLIYGSLICAKRFQSDRQNKEGCLQVDTKI